MIDHLSALRKAHEAIQIEVGACLHEKMEVPQHLKQADDALSQVLAPLSKVGASLSQKLYNEIVLRMAEAGLRLKENQKMVLASMVTSESVPAEIAALAGLEAERLARKFALEWTNLVKLDTLCKEVLSVQGASAHLPDALSGEQLKDALRYRWLRTESDELEDVTLSGDWWGLLAGCSGVDFDRMIDESMAAGKLVSPEQNSSGYAEYA